MRKSIIGLNIVGLAGFSHPAQADEGIAPLNYFLHAAGPAAYPTMVLDWVFTALVVGVCLLVTLLLLGALFHKRPKRPSYEIINSGPGLGWVLAGTGVSTVVLFAMAIYALVVLNESATPPHDPALTITVTGYDWWWKTDYDGFSTANEIHIPVGVPVLIQLKSADVIHAFWVPQLAGKTEMIPGLNNKQWFQADTPGIYRGQCTQFCGVQHAHMAFEVVAQSQKDFDAWMVSQRKPATKLSDRTALEGQHIFMNQCAACHTVRGTDAAGNHAPDLTHLYSRRLIAAGMFTTTSEHVMDWVEHAQKLKEGSRMPNFPLSKEEEFTLSTYLETLK